MTKEDYDIEVAKEYTTLQERIATLEKENKVLAQNLEDTEILNNTYEKRFDNLKKENAELKADFIKSCKVKEQGFREAEQALERKDDRLTKAKDILRMIVYWKSDKKELLNFINKAEQFLKENE